MAADLLLVVGEVAHEAIAIPSACARLWHLLPGRLVFALAAEGFGPDQFAAVLLDVFERAPAELRPVAIALTTQPGRVLLEAKGPGGVLERTLLFVKEAPNVV